MLSLYGKAHWRRPVHAICAVRPDLNEKLVPISCNKVNAPDEFTVLRIIMNCGDLDREMSN